VKEAYIKLRTNLMFCMTADKQRQCRSFAVTSAMPSEGKSISAANIAISFAMLGKKTLLVDADMRKPAQRAIWRAGSTKGICDYLANLGPLKTFKVNTIPLTIIFTGTVPPNPSELLASGRMKSFMGKSTESYDYVIIDTPPINTVADAQIISTYVDGIVLIARSGSTTSDELGTAIESIQRADGNICGVVLNDMNMKSMRYSYRYRYGDKYGYKYGYTIYGEKNEATE
jgi:capsular exopolysaccharide synthesis family protein